MNHHYLPQFYLKKWAVKDKSNIDKIITYHMPYSNVKVKMSVPRSTSCVEDLYILKHTADNQFIEKKFFSEIDDKGAKVFEKIIESGVNAISIEERVNFARFILSLRIRHPSTIKKASKSVPKLASKLENEIKSFFPEIPQEIVEKDVEEFKDDVILKLILMHSSPINSKLNPYNVGEFDQKIDALLSAVWWVEDFSDLPLTILTSDWPSVFLKPPEITLSEFNQSCLIDKLMVSIIAIPLTPNKIFFSAKKAVLIREKSGFLKLFNKNIVCQERKKFVYASDHSHEKFIKKYFFMNKL